MNAERNHLALEVATELADVVVLRVQHRHTAGMKSLNHLVFRTRDVSQRSEELEMHRRHTSHYSQIVVRERAKRVNLSRVIHPHLNHGEIMPALELKQLKRKSNMVVEISGALHDTNARA